MKISVTCADPTPTNGQVNSTGQNNGRYIIGTTISYVCDTAYWLNGSTFSTCLTSGGWDPPAPICLPGNESKKL